jgi:type IV pilus assembly protein PilW
MPSKRSQAGSSLAAALVGLAAGAITVVAILATFASTEALKRNAVGIADAQHGGALAVLALVTDIANAGHGLAPAIHELATCPDSGELRTSLRPVPILINAGAAAEASDSISVNSSGGHAIAGALALASAPASGLALRVRSPLGLGVDDAVAVVGLDGSCEVTTLSAISGPDPDGVIDAVHTGLNGAFPLTALIVDLGPRGRWRRVRYDIAEGSLRSLDLATPGATPNPLLANAVLLKAQYGIDSDGDGTLDAWVGAGAAPWTPATVLAAPAATLASVKAVRFGIVVRSETPDRAVTTPFRWVMFDCGQDDAASCPGRLSGALPPGWRYLTLEAVVPLRNQIWAARP